MKGLHADVREIRHKWNLTLYITHQPQVTGTNGSLNLKSRKTIPSSWTRIFRVATFEDYINRQLLQAA